MEAYNLGIEDFQKSNDVDFTDKQYELKEPEVLEICEGIKLVYREDPDCRLFNLSIASEGGQRAESSHNTGLFNIFANLICTQTETRSYEELLYHSEGEGIVLAGFSGKDSFGVKLQCLTEQAQEMTSLWADCFLNPKFPKRQFETVMIELEADFNSAKDAPSQLAILKLQEQVFGEHPYKHPIYGDEEITKTIEFDSLEANFYKFRDGSKWVIGGVGSLPAQSVAAQLRQEFKNWKFDVNSSYPLKNSVTGSAQASKAVIRKDKEQCHIILGRLGVSWGHEDRSALDVVMNALGVAEADFS